MKNGVEIRMPFMDHRIVTFVNSLPYSSKFGNGYTKTLLSFIQLFIVSNQTNTWYFANNNERHFSFDADERFLPIYKFADKDNNKITQLRTL